MARRRVLGGIVLVVALVAASCTGDDGGDTLDLSDAAEAAFTAVGTTGQVTVTDAEPGETLRLVDDDGAPVPALFSPDGHRATEEVVDADGNLIFGRVPPGEGYRVVGGTADRPVASPALAVGALEDTPDGGLFAGQALEEGFQYIETRDGTLLSAMVRFPDAPLPGTPEGGPYPTVVEMSGYDPSNPDQPQPAMQFAGLVGYATVGVNIRGTACSGGALSFYESAQVADGYDVIETVAAQDWVQDGEVGMVGLSYPGITQLYMAQTQPPGLAAISPMSIIEDTYRGTLYPGGILNTGFAASWSEQVGDNAADPADGGGYPWVADRIADGDDTCEANQALRSQNLDLVAASRAEPYRDPARYDPVTPTEFADRIDIPVFLTGQWQDEQTGGHFPAIIDAFADNPRARFTMTNGPHADGLATQVSQRWLEFLDFYVAKRIPEVPAVVRALAPSVLAGAFGVETPVPPDRFTDFDSYEEALAAYEEEPRIRVLFENGAGGPDPGGPVATFEAGYEQWPPAEAEPTTLYFGPDGALGPDEPTAADDDPDGAVSYDHDPDQGAEVTLPGGAAEAFLAQPDYRWDPLDEGRAVSFETDPLDEDTVIVGPSRADVWLRSSAEDTDLEVTVTEVRPDGQEVYVQSGWLRASHRALDDDRTTELQPVATHLEDDAEPLPEGEFVEVSVEVFPVAHVFRAGSSLRVSIDTPGATRPRWEFDTVDAQGEFNTVAISADHPSRITLPVVEVDDVPAAPAPCPGLRGQPCRPYEPIVNTPAGAEESDELQGFVDDAAAEAEALEDTSEPGGTADATDGEGFDHSTAALRVLGDDPRLDELAVDCHQDDLASCDDLFVESPDGSLYEAYGATCGARLDEPTNRVCVDVLVGPGDDPAGLGNDAFLNELANQCAQGDMLDCDILYAEAETGSAYERFGGSCGGRVDTDDDCTELV